MPPRRYRVRVLALSKEEINCISGDVVHAAIRIHRHFGPGLLEHAYRQCLAQALEARGRTVAVERRADIVFEETVVENAYRMDLLVNEAVVVEVKAVERLAPVHIRQLNTYVALSGAPVGLLLNFGAPRMVDGIVRIVGQTYADAPGRDPVTVEENHATPLDSGHP